MIPIALPETARKPAGAGGSTLRCDACGSDPECVRHMHATPTFGEVAGYGRPLGRHVGSALATLMTPPVMMLCSPRPRSPPIESGGARTAVARAPYAGGGRKVLRSLPAEAREGDVDDNHPPDKVLVGERG